MYGQGMGRWHVLREPTVPILLLASVMHVVRRNPFDFILFFGTAVVIVVDSRRGRAVPARATFDDAGRAAPIATRFRWLISAAIAVFAALVSLMPVAGGLVRVVLSFVGIGALVLVIVTGQHAALPVGERRSGRVGGWQVWAIAGVLACLWELTSFIAQQVWPADQVDHPAASDLIGPELSTWIGRAIFLALWASAGWWLLHHIVSSSVGSAPSATGAGRPPVSPPTDAEQRSADVPARRRDASPPQPPRSTGDWRPGP